MDGGVVQARPLFSTVYLVSCGGVGGREESMLFKARQQPPKKGIQMVGRLPCKGLIHGTSSFSIDTTDRETEKDEEWEDI